MSLGTALYLSGNTVRNRFAGSKALALYAHEVASHYSVTVALPTEHCAAENLDDWVRPLIADSIERRGRQTGAATALSQTSRTLSALAIRAPRLDMKLENLRD